jgi:hypothetical protein
MTEVVPLNEREVYRAVGKLFASFPVVARKGASIEAYVQALSRLPLSFVVEACDYAVRGRIGDGKSIPPAAELAHLARVLHTRTLPRTRVSENYVINSPDQRKNIVQGFRNLLNDLRTGRPIDPDLATAKVFGFKGDKDGSFGEEEGS